MAWVDDGIVAAAIDAAASAADFIVINNDAVLSTEPASAPSLVFSLFYSPSLMQQRPSTPP